MKPIIQMGEKEFVASDAELRVDVRWIDEIEQSADGSTVITVGLPFKQLFAHCIHGRSSK